MGKRVVSSGSSTRTLWGISASSLSQLGESQEYSIRDLEFAIQEAEA